MWTIADRFQRHRYMPVIRGHNMNGIDILAGQEVAENLFGLCGAALLPQHLAALAEH